MADTLHIDNFIQTKYKKIELFCKRRIDSDRLMKILFESKDIHEVSARLKKQKCPEF